jgi:Mg-chelatase subunit ChlI
MNELSLGLQIALNSATLIAILYGLWRMIQATREAREARRLQAAATATVAENVQKIELATNSMKDALVKSTAEASRLGGREEMRIEQQNKP